MVYLIIAFFFMFILQGIMTFFQIKNYQKNVAEMRAQGDILIGQAKGGAFKAGCIVLIDIDRVEGSLGEARLMMGRSVFHKFKNTNILKGRNAYQMEEWIEEIENPQIRKAVSGAIEAMIEQQKVAEEEELEEHEDSNSYSTIETTEESSL
ncbi:MAG TPA: hypothetical protein DHN33_03675 [Eubacteriaceae bacterium]|nr:hypothetical protein [Eubacteriaceae bacterium]